MLRVLIVAAMGLSVAGRGEAWAQTVPASTPAPGADAPASPMMSEDPAVRIAHVQQDLIPALIARQRAAEARVAARRAFVAGSGSFVEAYPTLASRSLGDPQLLRGRLGVLDDRAVARAAEKGRPSPDVPDRVAGSWREARGEALTAEAAADALERDLITAVLAGLEGRPGLTTDAVEPYRDELEAARQAAVGRAAEATDEERDAAQRALALADERLQSFDRALRSLRLELAGGPGTDLEPLLQLARSADGRVVAGLLRNLRASLEGADAETLDAVLLEVGERELAEANELAGEPVPGPMGTTSGEIETELQNAQAELERLKDLGAALPEARFPGDPQRAQAIALRLARATKRVTVLQEALATAQEAESTEVAVSTTQSDAEAAQQRAEEAQARAADARERRVADLLSHFADAQSRQVEIGAKAATAEKLRRTANGEWAATLSSIEDGILAIQNRSALEDRSQAADEEHEAVRRLMATLRQSNLVNGDGLVQARALGAEHLERIREDRERIDDGRSLLEAVRGDTRDELSETLDRWSGNLDDEGELVDRMLSDLSAARDVGLLTLHDARLARRALAPYISREQRRADQATLIQDIGQEIVLLPSSVWMMARVRWQELGELTTRLTDYNVIRGIISGSLWTIGLIVGWWWARGQVSGWALLLAQRVRRWRPELRMADVAAVKDPTVRFLRNAVDLALGYLLIWSLDGGLKEITFVLLVYLQFSMYRVVLALFDLLVIPSSQVRPAAVVLRQDIFDLAQNTVKWFVGFWIVRGFVNFVTWEVLSLDRITSVLDGAFWWGWWGLVAWALWRWQPYLRERAAQYAEGHRVVAWLSRDDGNVFFRVPRAVGILFFFLARGVVDLLYRGAKDGSNLSWLLNLVTRYRLDDEKSEEVRVLTEEQRMAIVEARTEGRELLKRDEVHTTLAEGLAEWKRTHRRGLMALVGDRGMGKRTACEQLCKQLEDGGLPVHTAILDERITDEAGMRRWLSGVVGLDDVPDSLEALTEALEGLEPHGIVLRGVHRAFERRVGGLAAISGLLYVLNATSDRHFWVVDVHRPAWDWFASVGSLVDTGVFRSVIRLLPMSSSQLRSLMTARLGSIGLRVDYSNLVRSSAFGADPEVELERSIAVFYRLLAEASDGNPTIAMHLFSRCLVPTEDDHVVAVRMAGALSKGVIDGLNEPALFVLTALRLQDELTLEQLVDITNLSVPAVRTTVRDLASRGLVERHDGELRIPDEELQTVARTLRRRHFMHLGAA